MWLVFVTQIYHVTSRIDYLRIGKRGIEVKGRGGRRRRTLLDDLKVKRGYSHLTEDILDRTMWRAGFGRGFGPVLRQTAK
jgi:hypothetical protein